MVTPHVKTPGNPLFERPVVIEVPSSPLSSIDSMIHGHGFNPHISTWTFRHLPDILLLRTDTAYILHIIPTYTAGYSTSLNLSFYTAGYSTLLKLSFYTAGYSIIGLHGLY